MVLLGSSELDFLLEFACDRHGLVFVRTADESRVRAFISRPGVVIVYAGARQAGLPAANAVFLRELLGGAAP